VTRPDQGAAIALALDPPKEGVSSADRLSFSLFLAAALHIALILGIGFTLPEPSPPRRSLDVTLAQFRSEAPPENADFLAQADQEASGTLTERRELTTDRDAPLDDVEVRDAAEPVPSTAPAPTPEIATLAGAAEADRSAPEQAVEATPDTASTGAEFLLQRALDMASLDARRSTEVQTDAQGRRIRRLTSVSTRTAVEAAYLQSWRRKVEAIGNLNYPAEARRQSLEGDLRMLVEIDASGELIDVRILESSGSDVLDQAALRIVRLAAPYLPFPESLRAETDVLQIIRTWQFRARGFGSG
jgi:protein TonB